MHRPRRVPAAVTLWASPRAAATKAAVAAYRRQRTLRQSRNRRCPAAHDPVPSNDQDSTVSLAARLVSLHYASDLMGNALLCVLRAANSNRARPFMGPGQRHGRVLFLPSRVRISRISSWHRHSTMGRAMDDGGRIADRRSRLGRHCGGPNIVGVLFRLGLGRNLHVVVSV